MRVPLQIKTLGRTMSFLPTDVGKQGRHMVLLAHPTAWRKIKESMESLLGIDSNTF